MSDIYDEMLDEYVEMFTKHEYRTVDIPVFKGLLALDLTVSLMKQEGWEPIALISPDESYPHNSVLFWKEVTGA